MRRFRHLLRAVIVVSLAAGVAGATTYAYFDGSTRSQGNRLTAGTVALTDDDSGGTVVSLSNADAGATATGCIEVHYTGSLPAEIRLRALVSGAVANDLDLRVTRGTGASGFPGCGSFSPDATDYLGKGAGVVYDGTLGAFPASWTSGTLDPPGATQETWTQGEKHAYRIRVSVPSGGGAQGKAPATATFTWEARNL